MRLAFAIFVGCLIVSSSSHDVAAQRSAVSITRIYTDAGLHTHAEQVDVKMTPSAGRFLQWRSASETMKVNSSQFVRFAPGFVEDWHPAADRRYLVTLSGNGEVDVEDGTKVPANPGTVVFTEDLTGKGHMLRTVGNADWVVLFLHVADQ